ncbi:MAG: helix-turn-helix domain-containing protein [Acidimicrobiales bacterium]
MVTKRDPLGRPAPAGSSPPLSQKSSSLRRATGRPRAALVLTGGDREVLERWARGARTPQSLARRARIVLASAAEATNLEVAEQLSVSPSTVAKWRARFIDRGLSGLQDRPRSGAPRRITEEQERMILEQLRDSPPLPASRWSTRSMAQETGLSQSAISRIWRRHGIHSPDQLGPSRAVAKKPLSSRGS